MAWVAEFAEMAGIVLFLNALRSVRKEVDPHGRAHLLLFEVI